ncbi:hypothetical protein CUU64_21335 [Bacillus sp. V5-8f]|nr:hypothetical protein CUU64_21335 [Bacillus sp. V5-8f]
MISQDDFVKGKNHVNIPGMKGLPSPSIVHSDFELVPNSHPGFEVHILIFFNMLLPMKYI